MAASTYSFKNEGPSKKGGFSCYRIEGTAAEVNAAADLIKATPGTRYIDVRVWNDDDAYVTFEASASSEIAVRAKLDLKKARRMVFASAKAEDMGEGFDGFGKVWTIRDEDTSVYGFEPGRDYAVKYAYFI